MMHAPLVYSQPRPGGFQDARTDRTEGGERSSAPRRTETADGRRRELVALLGNGLVRVIERLPVDREVLSESAATRVELPGDAGLSVSGGGGCSRDRGS